jgi:ketosteroid isomerase-like protein
VTLNRSRRTDDVSLVGSFGPCKKGGQDIARTFDWVAGRYREGTVQSEFEVVHEGAGLANTVRYERGELALDGGERRRQTIRVTQIYRRDGDRWWLVHRHGDFAPLDESPPSPAAS